MKVLTNSLSGKIRLMPALLLALLLVGLVSSSQAQPYSLTSQNSTLNLDVASGPGGVNDWIVDGVDQLASQWLYFRVGSSGGESPIQAINANPFASLSGANGLSVVYSNAQWNITVNYTLSGSTTGSGHSGLQETISIKNTSGSSQVMHLYQYSDFDLGGQTGNQSVQFTADSTPGPGMGQYYLVSQTSGAWTVTESVTHGAVPLGSVEAAVFNQTLASLTDVNPTTLNNSYSAGPDNVTYAYEWDLTIPNGGTRLISKVLTVVPEPSSAALILLGAMAFRAAGRRRAA
jgi:hypothetical protein